MIFETIKQKNSLALHERKNRGKILRTKTEGLFHVAAITFFWSNYVVTEMAKAWNATRWEKRRAPCMLILYINLNILEMYFEKVREKLYISHFRW